MKLLMAPFLRVFEREAKGKPLFLGGVRLVLLGKFIEWEYTCLTKLALHAGTWYNHAPLSHYE